MIFLEERITEISLAINRVCCWRLSLGDKSNKGYSDGIL